jgi:phage I-like protein
MERSVNSRLITSSHASSAERGTLCAAVEMTAGATVPDWVHLLPGGTIATLDGRGPYRVADMHQLIARSLPDGARLVIDENHATDLAAPNGQPAPARGWIVGLESRTDGLWGQVEWTPEGKALVEGKAYRALSPVIVHDKAGVVASLLRASLVNRPNIKNLATLHQESAMDLSARLAAVLGLEVSVSADALVAAVTTLHAAQAGHATALQAQLAPIARAAGLTEAASADQVVTAIGALAAKPGGDAIAALQAELATVTTELSTLKTTANRKAAEAFVDGAIKEGRAGVRPLRDHYVTRHMADAASVEKEIMALPSLGGRVLPTGEPPRDGEIALNAEQLAVARMLGQDPKAYAETLKLEQAQL